MSAPVIQTAPGGQRYAVITGYSQIEALLVEASERGIKRLVVERDQFAGFAAFTLNYNSELRDDAWNLELTTGFMKPGSCEVAAEKANRRIVAPRFSLEGCGGAAR